jgi:hypothetical protein
LFVDPVPEDLTVDFGRRHLTEELTVRALKAVGVGRRVMGQLRHGIVLCVYVLIGAQAWIKFTYRNKH